MDKLIVRSTRRCLSGLLIFSFALLVGCGSSDSGSNDQSSVDKANEVKPDKVILSISRFGKGLISNSDSSISCDQALCQHVVLDQQKISLTAKPESGWELHDWKGCDKVVGNVCTVMASEDTLVEPSFKTIEPAQLRSDVFVMPKQTVDKILVKEDDYLIFSPTATEISSLPIGTVILSQYDEGFAGRITNIETQPGSAIVVSYRIARIFEVYGEGTLFSEPGKSLSIPVRLQSRDSKVNARSQSSGVGFTTVLIDKTFTFPEDKDKDDDDGKKHNGVKLKLAAKLEVTPDYAINIGWGSVEEFKVAYGYAAKIDPEINLEVPSRPDDPQKIEPFKKQLRKFKRPVMVGLVPFVVEAVPVIEFTYKSGAKVLAGMNNQTNFRFGVHYLETTGFNGIGSFDGSASTPHITAEVGGEAEALLGGKIGLKVLGLAGPAVTAAGYVKGTASGGLVFSPDSETPECVSILGTWGGKVTGKIEADFHMLGNFSSDSLTLIDKYRIFYKNVIGRGCLPSMPKQPTDLMIEGKTYNSVSLSWKAPVTHETIKHYEVYRDDVLIPTSVANGSSLIFTDTGLQGSTRYCYYVRARTTDDFVTRESQAKCATTEKAPDDVAPTKPGPVKFDLVTSTAVKVSWGASSDNLGSKINYFLYLVTDKDVKDPQSDQLLAVTPKLDAVVDKLQAATEYCVYVIAADSDGNLSEFSDTVCEDTNEQGVYRLQMKCAVQDEYAVDTALDLNTELTNEVNAIGTSQDYNGSGVQFALSGYYSDVHKMLDAEVSWTFKGDDCVRKDSFRLNMGTRLGQDQAMEQVNICGCQAEVNISKNTSPDTPNNENRRTLRSHVNGGSTLSGR